jgi:hypothetical protein
MHLPQTPAKKARIKHSSPPPATKFSYTSATIVSRIPALVKPYVGKSGLAHLKESYFSLRANGVVDLEAQVNDATTEQLQRLHGKLNGRRLDTACNLAHYYMLIHRRYDNKKLTATLATLKSKLQLKLPPKFDARNLLDHSYLFENLCALPVLYFVDGIFPSQLHFKNLRKLLPVALVAQLDKAAAYLVKLQQRADNDDHDDDNNEDAEQANAAELRLWPPVLRIWQERQCRWREVVLQFAFNTPPPPRHKASGAVAGAAAAGDDGSDQNDEG